jgi:hypothetical protein
MAVYFRQRWSGKIRRCDEGALSSRLTHYSCQCTCPTVLDLSPRARAMTSVFVVARAAYLQAVAIRAERRT